MQNNSKKTIVLFIILVVIIGVQFWVSNLNKRADVGNEVVSNTTHEIKGNLNQVNIGEYVDSQYGFSIKHPVATEALKDTYFCDEKKCEHEDFVTFTIKNKEGVMPHALEVARINILKKNTENTISKLSTSFKNKETVSLGGNIFTKGTVSVDGGYTDYLTESNGYIFEIIFYKDKDGKEYSSYPDLSSLNFTKSNDVVLKEYKNDQLGISFKYPVSCGDISLESQKGKIGFLFYENFKVSDECILSGLYAKTISYIPVDGETSACLPEKFDDKYSNYSTPTPDSVKIKIYDPEIFSTNDCNPTLGEIDATVNLKNSSFVLRGKKSYSFLTILDSLKVY